VQADACRPLRLFPVAFGPARLHPALACLIFPARSGFPNTEHFSNAALVVLGHGTDLDPQSSAPVTFASLDGVAGRG
jgi:hypothetical protein